MLAGCVTETDEQKPRDKPTMAATVSSVTLEDVPLGVPVGLRLPNGGYYALRNDSSATLNAVVSPMVPTYCQRLPGQPVYSPVTNLSWIAVEPRTFKIPPHSESETMVVITLPNDESLRGRHLEFWLHAQALVGGMGSVGLYSRIRLNVAKGEVRGLERVTPRPARTGKIPAMQ
ncbi:MAG: hypothetical protein E7049_03940 [Lentisphaerae bacterium]|nr:hypothetical protein [Lentisphaerota bacterium]